MAGAHTGCLLGVTDARWGKTAEHYSLVFLQTASAGDKRSAKEKAGLEPG